MSKRQISHQKNMQYYIVSLKCNGLRDSESIKQTQLSCDVFDYFDNNLQIDDDYFTM